MDLWHGQEWSMDIALLLQIGVRLPGKQVLSIRKGRIGLSLALCGLHLMSGSDSDCCASLLF